MRQTSHPKASVVCRPAGFLLLWLFTSTSGVGQQVETPPRIAEIDIRGNSEVSSEEIRTWLTSKVKSEFRKEILDDDRGRIIQGYAGEGFFFVKIGSVSTSRSGDNRLVTVHIEVDEGPPCTLDSLTFLGNQTIGSSELASELRDQIGVRFRPRLLEAAFQRILQMYEQHGYPFARIVIQDLGIRRTGSEVTAAPILSIDEGPIARIAELRVEGNESTKEYVIAREARVAPDELFRGDLPLKIKRRLDRLQLFSSVSVPELYVRPDGKTGLVIRVTEGAQNWFDGVVGYLPSSGPGESGTLTGLLDVQFRNLLGTGRKLSTRWYRESPATQEIELKYLEPWVASYPVNMRGEFYQRKQDSTYVQRKYDLSGEFLVSEHLMLGFTFSQSTVFPSEGLSARFVSESRTTSYGLSAFFDSRDEPVTPTEGVLYRAEFANGVKVIEQSLSNPERRSNGIRRLVLDLDHYLSPLHRQVVAFSVHLRDFQSVSIELSDVFRLGGGATLRGYRESQFLGSRLLWSNLEYRLLVGNRSFAYTFLDAGYAELPDQSSSGIAGAQITKFGYGVGLRIDTALGLVGVSLAFGEGDTFSTAKLHFRLINEF